MKRVVLVILLVVLSTVWVAVGNSRAWQQNPTPTPAALQPITAENADRVIELMRLRRARIASESDDGTLRVWGVAVE